MQSGESSRHSQAVVYNLEQSPIREEHHLVLEDQPQPYVADPQQVNLRFSSASLPGSSLTVGSSPSSSQNTGHVRETDSTTMLV